MGDTPDWTSQETMMLLSLDNLAHRYHLLPSEALGRGTTFDLYVLDISSKWVKYQNDQETAKRTGKAPVRKELSNEEMMDMIKRTREKK
jgi:hypothetical protein